MNAHRVALPLLLLAVVLGYVFLVDAVAGPAERPEVVAPTATTIEPRAGAALCMVGAGAPGEPAVELPELEDEAAAADDEEEAPAADDEDEAPTEEDDEAEPSDEVDDDTAPSDDGDQADQQEPAAPMATLIAARPPGAGSAPAQLERVDLVEGQRSATQLPAVFPSSDGRTGAVRADEPAASWLRWRDGAVAITREWRLEGVDGLPDATVSGPCTTTSAATHVVPGLSTVGGDEARLRLANPHDGPASAAIRFATPGDPQAPLVLQNLSVPPRSVREVVVNDALPERADLAALVEVTSGRLGVEGLQVSRSAIGDVDGVSLLQATTTASEDWTVPWAVDDDATSSWLWVLNRGERTATVELTLHTDDGGELPAGLTEVSVPEGELRRVDLSGTLPEGVSEAAVTARSNGVPIVVSGGVRRTAAAEERTGISVQLGAVTDTRWVVSGTANDQRRERLRLINPEGEPATVDITLFDGVQATTPEELQGIEVPAGSTRTVAIEDLLAPTSRWSAFVTASSGEVVVGRVGSDGGSGALHLVAGTGVPAANWTVTGSGLLAVPRPGLVAQLGTDGPRAPGDVPAGLLGDPDDPDAVEDDAPSPDDPDAVEDDAPSPDDPDGVEDDAESPDGDGAAGEGTP